LARNRLFLVAIYNLPQIMRIRELKCNQLGRLMSIQGTVTRTTEVKPELLVGNFMCKQCNAQVGPVEQQYKFTEPLRCSSDRCMNCVEWELQMSKSIFVDWQKIRVQEMS
jgi:DNA replication licensing factor MCM6